MPEGGARGAHSAPVSFTPDFRIRRLLPASKGLSHAMRAAASLPSFFSPLPYHLPLIFSVFRGSSKPFPNAASTGNLSLRSNCPIGARDQLAFRDAPRFPARIPRLTARKRAYLLCRWLLSGIEPFVSVPLPSMLEAKADEGPPPAQPVVSMTTNQPPGPNGSGGWLCFVCNHYADLRRLHGPGFYRITSTPPI